MKRLFRVTVTVLAVVFAICAPRAAAEPLAVRCGRILDPATRTVRTGATVFLDDGKVSAATPPAGARTLDLSAFTCLPGLIDAHTHLLLQGDATSAEYDEQVLLESGPYRALRAARAATIALDHGFTTVRDLGTEGAGFADVDLKRAFERGVLPGPRVFASGPAMSVTGGYPLLGYSWERKMPDGVLKCDGPDDCRKAVRFQVQNGVDWIKVYADRSYYRTPEGGWAAIPNFTPEEMKAIVEEAHKLRKKVAAHSMTPSGHRVALSAGVDSTRARRRPRRRHRESNGRPESRVLPDDHGLGLREGPAVEDEPDLGPALDRRAGLLQEGIQGRRSDRVRNGRGRVRLGQAEPGRGVLLHGRVGHDAVGRAPLGHRRRGRSPRASGHAGLPRAWLCGRSRGGRGRPADGHQGDGEDGRGDFARKGREEAGLTRTLSRRVALSLAAPLVFFLESESALAQAPAEPVAPTAQPASVLHLS